MDKIKTFLIIGFVSIFLLISQDAASGATYYVDQTSGLDGNIGTATDQAWQTINKVNSSSFSAGDSILFKKGEIWREQLTTPSSGASGTPILFGSYGTGNRPKIYGSTQITTWDNSSIPAGTGDLSDESFEGTGYEETWTETVGSGSIVDEDSTDITPPTDGGSQILKVQKVSSNYNAKTSRDLGSEQNTTYARFYVYITAEGMANGQEIYLARGLNASLTMPWYFGITQNSSGEVRFRFALYNNGTTAYYSYPSTAPGTGSINVNQWYKVEVKYDATNLTWEWRLDGTSLYSGSLTGTLRNPPRYFELGDAGLSLTMTAYIDRFAVNSSSYLSESQALPANVWKSAIGSAPSGAWFITPDSVVHWGDKKSQLTDLVAQYDWYQGNNYVFTYAVSDPTALYSAMEVATRDYAVYADNKSYLTIQNLETVYNGLAGIKTLEGSDITISGNSTHHTGENFGTGSLGRSLWTSGTDNILIASNIVHNSALSGIWTYTGTDNNSGIVIENNESYDNGHTNIDVLCSKASIMTVSNVTIRYNNAYFTSSYPDLNVGSNNYFISGQSSCTVSNVNVYHNLGYNTAGAQLQLNYKVSNANIYNNTFVGTLPGINAWVSGINIDAVTDGTTNVVLKNNTVQDIYSGVGGGDRAFAYKDLNSFSAVNYNNWYQAAGGTRIYAGLIGSSSYHYDDFALYKSDTGFDASGFWQDPVYVSTSSPNLRLLRTSGLIDNGVNLGITLDYAGTSIPQGAGYDIGAYEYIPLNVTINQAVGQSDPTSSSTVDFTAVFSESVADFATGDVTLSGTAGATTAIVTGSGTTYNIAVSGMATSGTVLASIAVDKATGSTGNTNEASTSTDNSITYSTTNPPVLTSITISDSSGYTNDSTPIISVVSSNNPSHVAFSCNSGSDWSSWIVYNDSISSSNITSSATGCSSSDSSKTITAKLKNLASEESSTTNDSTYYDTTGPSIPTTPTTTTGSADITPTWTWTASTDAGAGLGSTPYTVQWCQNPDHSGCSTNTATSTSNSFTHATSLNYDTWYFRAKATDALNQESSFSGNGSITLTASGGGGNISGGGGGYVFPSPTPTHTNISTYATTTPNYGEGLSEEERQRLIKILTEKLKELLTLLIKLLTEKIQEMTQTKTLT